MANFNSLQEVQDFRFLHGTVHHVIVNGQNEPFRYVLSKRCIENMQ